MFVLLFPIHNPRGFEALLEVLQTLSIESVEFLGYLAINGRLPRFITRLSAIIVVLRGARRTAVGDRDAR
jgi:hypothetical protein